jgi:hypothetical protein
VFVVLAAQARRRTRSQLWITATGCSLNALVLWARHPGLRWLGAGFGAAAAYGIWGLADAALGSLGVAPRDRHALARTLKLVRGAALATGAAAAAVAVLGFVALLLDNWMH